MKKALLEKMVKDTVERYSSAIDLVLQPTQECGYKRYKSTKESLIKESLKLKQMLGVPIKEMLNPPEYKEEVIIESARQFESLADKILSNDTVQEKIATLEAYLLGDNKQVLESYLNEGDDLGIELQKAVVKNLIETLVGITEACKKKKKKKK